MILNCINHKLARTFTCIGVVLCPEELDVPLYSGSSFTYSWNETEIGSILFHECPPECSEVAEYPEGAMLVRECLDVGGEIGEWMAVDLNRCQLSQTALELCEANLQVCSQTWQKPSDNHSLLSMCSWMIPQWRLCLRQWLT